MSKKLIAVASAAAIALSALVGVSPASANDVSLTITGGGAEAGTASTTAISVNVPASNTVVWSTAANTTGTALRVVATAAAGATLNITSTGGAAKFLTTAQFDATAPNAATSATGSSSLSGVATGGTFTFYITTTSVDVSTIVVESPSSKVTRFIKGTAGLAYNVTATGPSFVQTAVAADVVVRATDIFGNPVSVGGNQITATYLGGVSENTTATAYRTATRDAVIKVQGTATFGPGSILVSIADDARRAAADIAGFPARSFSTFISVNNSNPVTQVTALQAQVAALTAQLAATVTKAKYNKLARKWNRANPNNRVKLVK